MSNNPNKYLEIQSSDQSAPQSRKRRILYQVGMFSLCYVAWVCVHTQREYWAMSKKTIQGQHEGLPKTYFGSIDTALFISYGLAQFWTGTIGDIFNKRYVLTISFTI